MLRTLRANSASGYVAREETYQGRNYLVVPMVAVVEGVHAGLAGTFYYPAAQIEANPEDWEGVPLPVDHPQDNQGNLFSINEDGYLERLSIGIARNMSASNGRLTGEAWIDLERATSVPLGADVVASARAGLPIEVSTSMFADAIEPAGIWNGEAYEATLVNYRPDHIAILPGQVGACSLSDGCGIRANRKSGHKGEPMKKVLQALKKAADWLALNEASLDDIYGSLSNFVNALDSPEYINFLHDVYDGYFIYETRRRDNMTGVTVASRLYKRSYTVNAETSAVAVSDDAAEVREETSYIPVANAPAADPPIAEPKTKITTHNQEENIAMKKALIDNLIACNCTRFEESDRPFLEGLSEAQLERLKVPENVIVKPTDPPPAPAANAQADPPKAPETSKPKTVDEALKAMPEPIANTIRRALRAEEIAKESIISTLTANAECPFTKEQLQAKPLEELQALAKLARVSVPEPDYSGQIGNMRANQESLGEYDVPEMPTSIPAATSQK